VLPLSLVVILWLIPILEYYRKRAVEERALTASDANDVVKAVHDELASHHETLLANAAVPLRLRIVE
jgi:hypothetical protein